MIYILDCGANDGCSIKKFKAEYLKDDVDFRILSYEPHPFFSEQLDSMKDERVAIHKFAVSTKNDNVNLYYSERCDGSTLNKTKTSNGISETRYITVKTIDICDIIRGLNLKNDDKLWIKMDIEGEEYNIIPHLHANNLLASIDRLFIEWHHTKLKNITKHVHEMCVDMVAHIETMEWDALPYTSIKHTDQQYKTYMKSLNNV